MFYSFQLIETYREAGRVKQRVLWNLGTWRNAAIALGSLEWEWTKKPPPEIRAMLLEAIKPLIRPEDVQEYADSRAQMARLEAVISPRL